MNIKNLFLKNFNMPVFGFNSGAFGGLVRGGNDFIGVDANRSRNTSKNKAFKILIGTGVSENAPKLREVSHAYRAFTRAGYEVDFVTPDGRPVQVSSSDLSDPVNQWFAEDATAQYKAHYTQKVEKTMPGHYVGIYFSGKIDPEMTDKWFRQLTELIHKNNGIVGGSGDAEEALRSLELTDQVNSGYSLPKKPMPETSAHAYGSIATEVISTDSEWLIHKGEVIENRSDDRYEITGRIIKMLAK